MKIGIDLGGTKTEAILLDSENQLVQKIRSQTPAKQGYSAILNNILSIVNRLEADNQSGCPIGIGTPGSIDKHTGLLKYSNTVCLNEKPLQEDLQTLLQRPVLVENDANCFALSEAIDGSGKDHKMVFGIIMGTGTGGGIVFNKSIIHGANGMGGEWGHTVLDPGGFACYCGLNGCIETYLSGPGLIKHFTHNGGKPVNRVEQLLELASNNDQIAIKTLDGYFTYFARAISTIIKILDPDIIVLGGGMSNIDALYTTAVERVNQFFANPVTVNIRQNTHGDSSGVRGAAFLCNDSM